jgi:hypothetical protein
MSLDEYITLTGLTISSSRQNQVTAQLARCQSILESLVGFTLDTTLVMQNLYNEVGKTPFGLSCPGVDTENLLPPDEVIGAYRLYPFNEEDSYIALDPFKTIHAVKLVHGSVTVLTFSAGHYRPEVGRLGLAKYVELLPLWYRYFDVLWFQRAWPLCSCRVSWQLAVDADWLWPDEIPGDLAYVLADMVTYYANPKRELKSQTVGAHSFTQTLTVPQDRPENLAILRRYAGPFGSLSAGGVL